MNDLLIMKNITKQFGDVIAVDDVSIRINKGEVLSLCGENGSGKSTLMKVLCGVYPFGTFEGEIYFEGIQLKAKKIKDSEDLGIVIIHQELALIKEMTVLENLFLGIELNSGLFLDENKMYIRAIELLKKVKLDIDPNTKIGLLGLGQQQLIEIAKALNKNVKLLVLDEPSASLTEKETEVLLEIIQELKQQDIACVYISHKLNEVKYISDTILVIRDGLFIDCLPAEQLSENEIIQKMVGRELKDLYPKLNHKIGEEILRAENITAWHPVNKNIKRVDNISFNLKEREILGVAGLVGAGRSELMQCLFGAYEGKYQGEIYLDNKKISIKTPKQALDNRIAMVPEDRKKDGIIPLLSVGENITLTTLPDYSKSGVIEQSIELKKIMQLIEQLKIKTSSPTLSIKNLSGGNQQKAIIAKYLLLNPKILILDEPTRGIDIGAKQEIYKIIVDLAERGLSVIVISSELPEVLGLSHRVLVMHEGKFKANLINENLTQEIIMQAALTGD